MSLDEYRRNRDFERTAEPPGREQAKRRARYVIQKHAASRLHYDFRLELDGVLKSWAVPKGPSLDPNVKSLAVQVEDHPLEYGNFEGVIPKGQYGGGTVMLWDHGTWEPEGDPVEGYRRGKLVFRLFGERLKGRWTLIRMGGKASDGGKNWLLKKLDDDGSATTRDDNLLARMTTSVVSGRTMEQIARGDEAVKAPRRDSKGASGRPGRISGFGQRRLTNQNRSSKIAMPALYPYALRSLLTPRTFCSGRSWRRGAARRSRGQAAQKQTGGEQERERTGE